MTPDCQEFLDQFYPKVTPWMFERLKTVASRGDVLALLRAYVDECEDFRGIGPNSAVRAAESKDAREFLAFLEEHPWLEKALPNS